MQRLGQTVVFLFAFVGVALVLFRAAAPRLLPPAAAPIAPVLPPNLEPVFAPNTSPALPNPLIAPPQTASQREADDIEVRRAPYYRWLHSKFGDVLSAQQSSSADAATLDLYTTQADPSLVLSLLGQAGQPYADQYGFNHVRFFMPNAPGSVERYRFAAEASPSADRRWKAFEK